MYPKNFFANVTNDPKAGTCFVVMPFAKKFDVVFQLIRETLERELRLKCGRADDVLGGGNIMEDVLRGMAESELIIVDVTARNPNVFYELGIAHMCKPVEKVLLLSQDEQSIPFDLRPFRHIIYKPTTQGRHALRDSLKQSVVAVLGEVYRIVLDRDAKGTLDQMIMGGDRAIYQFEALGGTVGPNFVKTELRITRHAIEGKSATLSKRVVFQEGLGLKLGEVRALDRTGWAIAFEKIGQDESCLRIDRADTQRPRMNEPRLRERKRKPRK
jgi:hypothetical protein